MAIGKRHKIVLVVLVALLVQSCSPEWKLARRFVNSAPDIAVLVLPPDNLIKTNLKQKNAEGAHPKNDDDESPEGSGFTVFLDELSDSIFLETYVNNFLDEIERLGMQLFTEEYADSFLFLPGKAFLINMAQIQLEEYYLRHEDSDEFGGYTYFKTMYLNAVNFNKWFEITRLNVPGKRMEVLYDSYEITDDLQGYFTENLFSGKVNYNYRLTEMTTDDLYDAGYGLGAMHASLIFDHLMNSYVSHNFPEGRKRRFYIHYDRRRNALRISAERFVIMQ